MRKNKSEPKCILLLHKEQTVQVSDSRRIGTGQRKLYSIIYAGYKIFNNLLGL